MKSLSTVYELIVHERPSRKSIASIISAVEEARKQIPLDLEQFRFFGKDDTWIYHAVFDEILCILCQRKTVPFTYSGIHLRAEFPWLEIEAENRIGAWVHPNCRCYLQRLTDRTKPIAPLKFKMKRKLKRVREL